MGDSRSYSYDPDGRTASVTAKSFGEISYTYDVDGNELTATEPTKAQGYDGGSFICYEYYPDGLREYMTIGSAGGNYSSCTQVPNQASPSNDGISQYRILSYAYTGDGRLTEQDVNWGANLDQFSLAYAPSGREVSENDPLTGTNAYAPYSSSNPIKLTAKTYSYDSYGRVNGLVLPGEYQESSLVYDEEDELAGYSAGEAGSSSGGVSQPIILNSRGEMIQYGSGLTTQSQAETQSGNGAQVGDGDTTLGGVAYQLPPTTLEYDLRSNMVTCSTDPNYAKDWNNDAVYPLVSAYDAAGRRAYVGYDIQDGFNNTKCNPGSAQGPPIKFDAENHIQAGATWGPDGRQRISVISVSTGNITETAHWDGDALLFATGGNISPQLYIGKLGVMDYSGDVDVYDRDQTGAKASSHGVVTGNNRPAWMIENGNWVDGWSSGTVRTVEAYKSGKQYYIQTLTGSCNANFTVGGSTTYFACPPVAATFEMTRGDGYKMVGGIVQGARTFDTATGQWSTPDAYAGDVNDPMSQKPFVWNGNNSVKWSDPMGYSPDVCTGTDGSGSQVINIDYEIYAINANGTPETNSVDLTSFQNAVQKSNLQVGNYTLNITVNFVSDPSLANTTVMFTSGKEVDHEYPGTAFVPAAENEQGISRDLQVPAGNSGTTRFTDLQEALHLAGAMDHSYTNQNDALYFGQEDKVQPITQFDLKQIWDAWSPP